MGSAPSYPDDGTEQQPPREDLHDAETYIYNALRAMQNTRATDAPTPADLEDAVTELEGALRVVSSEYGTLCENGGSH